MGIPLKVVFETWPEFPLWFSSIHDFELVFAHAADRADPILGKVIERRSRLYPGVRVAFFRIVFVAAD